MSGLLCPVPVLMTAHAMAQLGPGEVLAIVGTDPEMLLDLPAWCERSGHRLLEIAAHDGRVRCRIEHATLRPGGTAEAGRVR